MRKYSFLVSAVLSLALIAGMSTSMHSALAESADEALPMLSLTAQELALFDGKDGMPAYVAVDGKVYDVTDVPQWQGGTHQGQYEAGQDLSEAIHNASPHGLSVLEDLPVVAVLLTGEEEEIPEAIMTYEALAAYNGKDGNPAYVAVDGIVYDVTDVPDWTGGTHAGQYEAGKDYTEVIRTLSPHGISVLEDVPVVARLVPDQIAALAEEAGA